MPHACTPYTVPAVAQVRTRDREPMSRHNYPVELLGRFSRAASSENGGCLQRRGRRRRDRGPGTRLEREPPGTANSPKSKTIRLLQTSNLAWVVSAQAPGRVVLSARAAPRNCRSEPPSRGIGNRRVLVRADPRLQQRRSSLTLSSRLLLARSTLSQIKRPTRPRDMCETHVYSCTVVYAISIVLPGSSSSDWGPGLRNARPGQLLSVEAARDAATMLC